MTTPTEQNQKLTTTKDVIAYLAAEYPACFSLSGEVKPLKVGIFQDLAAKLAADSPISKTQLRQALRVYTSSWRYLAATKQGVARVDLEGAAGDIIDEQQAEHAAVTLKESKAKAAEKRKAKIAATKAESAATDSDSAVDKPRNKKHLNKTKPSHSKAAVKPKVEAAKESQVTSPSAPAVKLEAIATDAVVVGANVLVKLGKMPMLATVLEVNKADVTVQLGSGMVIKTRQDSLYLA
ncbi:RNA chaperone ProQ [Rheinheimera sp. MMS21-TC3]|uniref:RNA chaperone ProQ n=1 Tax=Rheinheimera sp. MMS21-TC3 TaxID=3072790 RepID=UPI0028C4C27F|nr:RNA chaperone ProQ [Rheinheimera sp. MMS21-TC3]WNO60947.1 RNA chaperone ProQ [Rheinheimera sp. MMS21-TC3]